MSDSSDVYSNGKKRTIKEQSKDCFVVEGNAQYLKWSMTNGPKYVEFQNGPRLKVGEKFFDKGIIEDVEQIKTLDFYTKAVKVKLK